MRIRFAARSDEDEAVALDAMRHRVDAFWKDSAERIVHAGDGDERELERVLTEAAHRAAPGVSIEVDALEGGVRRVIVVPEFEMAAELLAEEFVKRAPRTPKLNVGRFRPEVGVAAALEDVKSRFDVDLERARVRVGFSRGHLLEAVVYSPSFASAADEHGVAAASRLVERLIGEELCHDFVGSVEVAPLPRGGSLRVLSDSSTAMDSTLPLGELLPAVEAAVRGLYAELPEAPYHTFCEHAEWTMLELEPPLAEDYGEKDDLALVSTMLPEATKCYLQGSPFSSVRFSKHGERFAYLKVDAVNRSPQKRHDLRVQLEDTLNNVLVPGGIGCVVGAGLGVRYVYIDLALQNLEHGVRVARERVRRLDLDLTAWALFCETGWEDEWVAVGDHGPPPKSDMRAHN